MCSSGNTAASASAITALRHCLNPDRLYGWCMPLNLLLPLHWSGRGALSRGFGTFFEASSDPDALAALKKLT